ncbi:MAG: LrgB family protein [Oscillospiraceae bacterium]|nr:LrgB family protein [Oscillospiraceae bacterium]
MKAYLLSMTANPLFGITLTVLVYLLSGWINRACRSPFVHPLLVSGAILIILLTVLDIPLENYQQGGNVITMLLMPATAALATSVYRQVQVLKKNFLPIVLGCLAGSVTAMASAYGLSKLFGLDKALTMSMIPKSVTTPIAVEISRYGGGIVAITAAAVVITGILGAVCAPLLIRFFRIKEPVAQGVAIGTCSHAIGTTKAIELGEIQGAMSGISIGVSGIMTVILAMFI